MFAESEHGHDHHHGTGIRWLDIIIGISVVFISVVSLVISISHGRTMERMEQQNEKMVAANTLPFLTFAGSQIDPATNKPHLRLILRNGGVGPALIDWFEIRYKGVTYGTPEALMRACCAAVLPKDYETWHKGLVYSNVSGSVLPPGEISEVVQLMPEASNELRKAFDNARQNMSARACYCSVLDECWQTDFDSARPKRVDECRAPEGDQLW